MRQRTSTGTGALLAVVLGALLSLGPTAALAEAATAQTAEAPEQQVTVRDNGVRGLHCPHLEAGLGPCR